MLVIVGIDPWMTLTGGLELRLGHFCHRAPKETISGSNGCSRRAQSSGLITAARRGESEKITFL
jgi:hypothetical protein